MSSNKGSNSSKAVNVGINGRNTSTATTLPTTATTHYQRLDGPTNPLSINNNISYDSEDSYRSSNTLRSYTSYNYMSTSIRDRINYSNSHQYQNNNNTPLSATAEQQPHQQQLLTEEDQQRIQYLALRKFHIPGHTFTQDYIYWYALTVYAGTCVSFFFLLTHSLSFSIREHIGSATIIHLYVFAMPTVDIHSVRSNESLI
jgi:hypothetical protein